MSIYSVNCSSCQVLLSFCFAFGGRRLYQSAPLEIMSKAWLKPASCLQPWRQASCEAQWLKEDAERDPLPVKYLLPSFRLVLQKCFNYMHSVRGCFFKNVLYLWAFLLWNVFSLGLLFLTELKQNICILGINHYERSRMNTTLSILTGVSHANVHILWLIVYPREAKSSTSTQAAHSCFLVCMFT